MDREFVMVTIRCITYNQVKYIRQCLEGFVNQQTNFRFEAIVHDDASTDGTTDIIREFAEKYPDIIKPIYEKENQYSKHDGSLAKIMDSLDYGKYIAVCEGDDYWTDPFKLQKQVDYLEQHPDCSMVHTRFNFLYENNNKIVSDDDIHKEITEIIKAKKTDIGFDILNHNNYRIQTVTTLFRSDYYKKVIAESKKEYGLFMMGDTQKWLNLLACGYIHYLPEVTSVYRIQTGSVSRTDDMKKKARFAISVAEMRLYYANKYNLSPSFFFRDYIKFLIKYRFYDPIYKTDSRIIKLNPLLEVLLRNRCVIALLKVAYGKKLSKN